MKPTCWLLSSESRRVLCVQAWIFRRTESSPPSQPSLIPSLQGTDATRPGDPLSNPLQLEGDPWSFTIPHPRFILGILQTWAQCWKVHQKLTNGSWCHLLGISIKSSQALTSEYSLVLSVDFFYLISWIFLRMQTKSPAFYLFWDQMCNFFFIQWWGSILFH